MLKTKRRVMVIKESVVPIERIEKRIYVIRNQKVMLSTDLANLYAVESKALNQAVKRNIERFPEDFMFQLSWEEVKALRSQIVTLKKSTGQHTKYRLYAFTEQGVAMLSTVLKSKRAIQVNIEIMRTFVKLKKMLASHDDLARKIDALERKYDDNFRVVFEAIRQLMELPKKKRNPVGFKPSEN